MTIKNMYFLYWEQRKAHHEDVVTALCTISPDLQGYEPGGQRCYVLPKDVLRSIRAILELEFGHNRRGTSSKDRHEHRLHWRGIGKEDESLEGTV